MRKKNFRLLIQGVLFLAVCVIFYYNKNSYVPDELGLSYEYNTSYSSTNNVAGNSALSYASDFANSTGNMPGNEPSAGNIHVSTTISGSSGSGGFSPISFNNISHDQEQGYISSPGYSYSAASNSSSSEGGGNSIGGFSYSLPIENKENRKGKSKNNNYNQNNGFSKKTPFQTSVTSSLPEIIMAGPGDPSSQDIPLDGNEIFIIIIGITFGLYALYKRNKEQPQVV